MQINIDKAYENLVHTSIPKLTYDEKESLEKQRTAAREKLKTLTGIPKIAQNACPSNLIIESEEEKEGYTQIRFCYESEKDLFIPAYLLIPKTGKKKYPVAITLQGHNKGGMRNSVGIIKAEEVFSWHGALALQAVKEGYAALCIELRGMSGELHPVKEQRSREGKEKVCLFPAMASLLMGRTLLGERCWDISRAIDLLDKFPQLDTEDILITGNSGGGTASYYAACLDERIKLSAPSCGFCTFEGSLLNVQHCPCNYIPNIYEWFDMQDLAVLLAPRKLLILAGQDDQIFLLEGVKKGYETVEKIYRQANAERNCRLLVTPKGHYWCEDIVWNAIKEIREKGEK